jgi:hypothetical protein
MYSWPEEIGPDGPATLWCEGLFATSWTSIENCIEFDQTQIQEIPQAALRLLSIDRDPF